MENNIFITGQIGTTYNDDGTINVQGVELEDVVNDFEKVKDSENVNIWINSNGGSVVVGKAIAEYLGSFKNVTTIADGNCMSIATIIHLCVPLENRKITQGTIYMIHLPLLTNFTGNSEDFINASKYLKPLEKEMCNIYTKKTGLSEQAISGMLSKETELNPEQVISMGFASEIIKSPLQLNPVAFVDYDYKNKNKMNKKTGLLAKVLAFVGLEQNNGRNALALTFEVEQGTLETPFEDLMVGDPVLLNGEQAPEGSYTLEDGSVITVIADGTISEIIAKTNEVEDLVVALQTENDELKAKISELEAERLEVEKVIETAQAQRSTYKPVIAMGNPKAKTVEKSPFELMMERRNDYKQNKK